MRQRDATFCVELLNAVGESGRLTDEAKITAARLAYKAGGPLPRDADMSDGGPRGNRLGDRAALRKANLELQRPEIRSYVADLISEAAGLTTHDVLRLTGDLARGGTRMVPMKVKVGRYEERIEMVEVVDRPNLGALRELIKLTFTPQTQKHEVDATTRSLEVVLLGAFDALPATDLHQPGRVVETYDAVPSLGDAEDEA